jgi:hypothetical protein
MAQWWRLATRRDVVRRATKVAILVGTILLAINHGDALLMGQLDGVRLTKILLTYLVPYLVSTYAAVDALVASQKISGD